MKQDPESMDRCARYLEEPLTRAMKECLATDGALLPRHIARHLVGQYQELAGDREDAFPPELMDEVGSIAERQGRRTIDVLRDALRRFVEEWKTKSTTSEPRRPIVFRAGGLCYDLDARHDEHGQSMGVSDDLGRYYRLLEKELRRIDLTTPELELLCDIVTRTSFDGENFDLLYGYVDKALHEAPGIAKKRGVDASELLRKLRELRPGQCLALIDAIERFWRAGCPKGPRFDVLQTAGYLGRKSGS